MNQKPAQRSRYNCRSNPPPALQAIVRGLQRVAGRRGGAIPTRHELRGLIQGCDRNEYGGNRGTADDCVRFLENTGVLTDREGAFVYDDARARTILLCCEDHTDPPPYVSPVPCRTAVRAPASAAHPTAEAEAESRPEPQPSSEPDHEQVDSDVAEPEGVDDIAPPVPDAEPEALPSPAVPPKPKTRVAYFTPLEYLVWGKLTDLAKLLENGAISTPFSAATFVDEFCTEIPDTDEDAICSVLDGFARYGLVSYRGTNSDDVQRRVYTLLCDPDVLHIVLMDDKREQLTVSSAYQRLIQAAQEADLCMPHDGNFIKRFERWVKAQFAGMDFTAVCRKLVGYDKLHSQQGWGIFHPCEGKEDDYLLCIRGYERFTFVAAETTKSSNLPKVVDSMPRYTLDDLRKFGLDHLRLLQEAWERIHADFASQTDLIVIAMREAKENERKALQQRLSTLEEEQRRIEEMAHANAAAIDELHRRLASENA